jgi:hypothetical protein
VPAHLFAVRNGVLSAVRSPVKRTVR